MNERHVGPKLRFTPVSPPSHNEDYHIYYTVAGFSEYDTYRAQQIRQGLITRDEALAMVARDNKPNMDELDDFAKQTGINLEEVLTRINSIEKLY